MKQLWVAIIFLLLQGIEGFATTVTDVKVSVTSDSAAAAREQALAKAHTVAFQKLLKESFPDASPSLPPQDILENMVTTFSIDKEKTTPESYTASLTFQFDDPQVQTWLHRDQSSPGQSISFSPFSEREGNPLKITATYATLSEWHHIKKTLEEKAGIQKMRILRLTPKNAELEVTYAADIAQLQQLLQHEKLSLKPQGQGWAISSTESPPLPKIVY